MKQFLYIFLGGGIGSVLRYLISVYTQKLWTVNAFPMGTFVVNIIGCFLIGIFSGYFLRNESDLKFLLIAGFCGGLTTFSTFSAENVSLWQANNFALLGIYTAISILAGFLAVGLGLSLSK